MATYLCHKGRYSTAYAAELRVTPGVTAAAMAAGAVVAAGKAGTDVVST